VDQRKSRDRCIVHSCHCGSTFDPGTVPLDIATEAHPGDLSELKTFCLDVGQKTGVKSFRFGNILNQKDF
jgi:hypothetical protein